jgi:hypothetical protein
MNSSEITMDQIVGLARQPHTYEDVVSRFGAPVTEWQSDRVNYAVYPVNEYASALSNIDGKGFVPGVGGFVDTYKLSESQVILSFDRKTGKYMGYSRDAAPPLHWVTTPGQP